MSSVRSQSRAYLACVMSYPAPRHRKPHVCQISGWCRRGRMRPRRMGERLLSDEEEKQMGRGLRNGAVRVL